MAEAGYVYCPICQAVMPKHPDLEQLPQFYRVLSHVRDHSTWTIFWYYYKEWWSGLFKGRVSRLNDDDVIDKTLGKFTEH